jgi:uncharacterized protein involved in response to NO
MIFPVFSNVFYGFTYTTFPRFSARPPVEPRHYLRVWLFNLLVAVSFYVSIAVPEAFYGAAIFMALSFAYTLRIFLEIYREAPEPRSDQYWIVVALGMGALANLLYLLAAVPCGSCRPGIFASWAAGVGVWLYLIFLPVVIGFRMVPFFSRVMVYAKSSLFHPVVFGLLLAHVVLENFWPRGLFGANLVLALWLGRELLRAHLPISNPDPLLWSLHLALAWLPLGFFVGALAEFAEAWFGVPSLKLSLHLPALGFLTTILVAFGTRVVLGHGGAALRVDRWGGSHFSGGPRRWSWDARFFRPWRGRVDFSPGSTSARRSGSCSGSPGRSGMGGSSFSAR